MTKARADIRLLVVKIPALLMFQQKTKFRHRESEPAGWAITIMWGGKLDGKSNFITII